MILIHYSALPTGVADCGLSPNINTNNMGTATAAFKCVKAATVIRINSRNNK